MENVTLSQSTFLDGRIQRLLLRGRGRSVVDRLPRLGKRELICLLLFTCNYVVSV